MANIKAEENFNTYKEYVDELKKTMDWHINTAEELNKKTSLSPEEQNLHAWHQDEAHDTTEEFKMTVPKLQTLFKRSLFYKDCRVISNRYGEGTVKNYQKNYNNMQVRWDDETINTYNYFLSGRYRGGTKQDPRNIRPLDMTQEQFDEC